MDSDNTMNKRSISALSALIAIAGLSFTITTQAADWQRGEELHNDQCVACHAQRFGNNGADIYTRPDRLVRSYKGLQRQVTRCRNNLEIVWFDEDVADVVAYLNRNYYKFNK